MENTKMILLAVLVTALAVPSLWAQKTHTRGTPSQSLKHIQSELQAKALATGQAAVCIASDTGSFAPTGYYSGTNKCSSGSANLGSPNSIQGPSETCSDKGGVEGTWSAGRTVQLPAAVSGSPFSFWSSSFFVATTETNNPDVYGDLFNIQSDVSLTTKAKQGVLGFEVSNAAPVSGGVAYSVTFHTTSGDLPVVTFNAGGADPLLDPGAARIVAICSAPAITGVDISCTGCSELSGDGANGVAQIRGDKFKGF